MNYKFAFQATAFLLLTVGTSYAQSREFRLDVDPEGEPFHEKWDSTRDRLILYRNSGIAALPAIRLVHEDNSVVSIYPLKSLPEAEFIYVWACAGTPDDGVVVSAIVRYSPENSKPMVLRSMLLTFDASGNLVKVWDVSPYHHHLLAVDDQGNVYAGGTQPSKDPNVPIFVKYSPSGEVLKEFLPAKSFPEGQEIVLSGSAMGEAEAFIKNGELYLWAARKTELLKFSLKGDLISRSSLKSALEKLKSDNGVQDASVRGIGTISDGILMQVVLWPRDKGAKAAFSMLKVPLDASQANMLSIPSVSPSPGHFLGTTSAGKMVFLEPPTSSEAKEFKVKQY
jgi:hypothetical protein